MTRYYLGLSTSGHDPAAALVDESGRVVFAEATERFLQDKRAWGGAPDHPGHLASILSGRVDSHAEIVVGTTWSRPKADLPVEITDGLLPASDGVWLRAAQARLLGAAGEGVAFIRGLKEPPQVHNFDHHLCHAIAACWSAPFDDGLCLVLDGEGEVGAASLYRLAEGRLDRIWRSWGPGSLGAFYGWLTSACGFDWRAGEEWKVMGLAAFGVPDADVLAALTPVIEVDRGRLRLSEEGVPVARRAIESISRKPGEDVMKAADLAATAQAAYAHLADQVLAACLAEGNGNLVLSGGCALNSAYNGTLLRRLPLQRVHVPSAPGDDGNALGAALLAWMHDHPGVALPKGEASPFLGSRPDPAVVQSVVRQGGFGRAEHLGEDSPRVLAERLAAGRIIGVMRGAAEFGPRALGHRSILADPRPAGMKDAINRRVKGREPYRPFAPVVPLARVGEWFEHAQPSPYMSFTLPWRKEWRDRVPAVVHEDGTGRLQTVDPVTHPWMAEVLGHFEAETGVPVVLNTSFNVMGKPMVHSVQDAMSVLVTTGLDGVLLDDVLIEKGRT